MKYLSNLTKMMVIGLILSTFSLLGEVIPLPDLISPDSINVDETQIYITEKTSVYIYNLKNFKQKIKFGELGEGPGEFMGNIQSTQAPLDLYVKSPQILVNSLNRVSFFSKEGEYIREIKTVDRSRRFRPLGNGFVGNLNARGADGKYRTLNLYDAKLKNLKEIYRVPHPMGNRSHGFRVWEAPMVYTTYKDMLFVAMDEDFIIRVFDFSGKELYAIAHNYKRRKVKEMERERIKDFINTHPRFKPILEILQPLYFPEYQPALQNVIVNDDKVYAIAAKLNQNESEGFIFDLKGNLKEKQIFRIMYVDEFDVFPYNIKNGKLYQLVEDEATEKWSLYISDVGKNTTL